MFRVGFINSEWVKTFRSKVQKCSNKGWKYSLKVNQPLRNRNIRLNKLKTLESTSFSFSDYPPCGCLNAHPSITFICFFKMVESLLKLYFSTSTFFICLMLWWSRGINGTLKGIIRNPREDFVCLNLFLQVLFCMNGLKNFRISETTNK